MTNDYFILADNAKLCYQDLGSGFPVIFLHGNNLSSQYFDKQISLSQNYRLILVDSRGHGRSGRGSLPLTFEQMSQDLEDLLAFLNIDTCVIVGHSDGANLGLVYVKHFPHRVAGLIFNAGNLHLDDLLWFSSLGIRLKYTLLSLLAPLSNYFRQSKEICSLMVSDLPLNDEDLEKIELPILLLCGKSDFIKLVAMTELARKLPETELIILPKTGHHPARTQARFFNKMIISFITKLH